MALICSDERLTIDLNGRQVLMRGERVQPTKTGFRLRAHQLLHAGPQSASIRVGVKAL